MDNQQASIAYGNLYYTIGIHMQAYLHPEFSTTMLHQLEVIELKID